MFRTAGLCAFPIHDHLLPITLPSPFVFFVPFVVSPYLCLSLYSHDMSEANPSIKEPGKTIQKPPPVFSFMIFMPFMVNAVFVFFHIANTPGHTAARGAKSNLIPILFYPHQIYPWHVLTPYEHCGIPVGWAKREACPSLFKEPPPTLPTNHAAPCTA